MYPIDHTIAYLERLEYYIIDIYERKNHKLERVFYQNHDQKVVHEYIFRELNPFTLSKSSYKKIITLLHAMKRHQIKHSHKTSNKEH